MGFLSKMAGALVKTVLTPVAIVKDGVDVLRGITPNTTKSLFESAGEDIVSGVENLADGDVL